MQLDHAAAMNLLKFICSFCWTDLKVQQQERDLVMQVVGKLGLGETDTNQVKAWLLVPPPVDEIDPTAIPQQHRELFLAAADAAVKADGKVVPAERDAVALFRGLLQG